MKTIALILLLATPAFAQSSFDGTTKNGPFWPQVKVQCSHARNICTAWEPGYACYGEPMPRGCVQEQPK